MPDQPRTSPEEPAAQGALSGSRDRQLIPFRGQIPQPSTEYRSAVGRWLRGGESLGAHGGQPAATNPWWKGIWLAGGAYLSALGCQPGVALLAAGAVAAIATVILVVVTLFGALPVYAQVARRSHAGAGSIAIVGS